MAENERSVYGRRPEPPQRRRSRSPLPRPSRSPILRRSHSPQSAYRRREPPKPRRRSPSRSPSPIRASPPREQIRPGGARGRGRNILAEQARLQAERERARAQTSPPKQQLSRGVQDVSNQFYNQRPEWVQQYGREWRTKESHIKGLRPYNNWVKSCIIQKFSPDPKETFEDEEVGWGEAPKEPKQRKPLCVLDIGCGKGGDLGKWQLAPQEVGLYVGIDPAETSIQQAGDRYFKMRRGRRPIFDGRFIARDCFGKWLGDVPIVREVGIDGGVGVAGHSSRWNDGGGFDVVTMMFSMHYAWESEEKVRMMLRNVAGSLKKGGRWIGVVPNSDMLRERILGWYNDKEKEAEAKGIKRKRDDAGDEESKPDGEMPTAECSDQPADQSKSDAKDSMNATPATANTDNDEGPFWGNSIYSVRFPAPSSVPAPLPLPKTSSDAFRPPFGHKYTFWMEEAVDVPEFVVPWEALRAIASQDYNLEQRYRKPFLDIWEVEKNDREMLELAKRMKVCEDVDGPGGEKRLLMSKEEKEAVAFYHAFCFVKV